ncbi:MAG: hypothetical protein KAI02_00940 [Gammaproteobacteria bacterium]|nr:hypothetical protein [Gammaproteobacteria bacterium]
MKNYSNTHKLQQQIAVETARLINEEGFDNIQLARKKAAHHLGIKDKHIFPNNEEILEQIKIHQNLYHNNDHGQTLIKLRQTALHAMTLFASFKPRLIGSVLLGHAHTQSSIDLLVMADSPEEIALFLIEKNIPYQLHDWKLFSSQHHYQLIPSYQFYAGDYQIKLITLSEKQRKMPPINPLTWKTMQKASIAQIKTLLKN